MRGLKSTIALFVVLIGLGAYIYFVVSEQDNTSGSNLEQVFESFDASTVAELTIRTDAGEETTVRKTDDRWQIVAPISAPASEVEVSAVTSALDQLSVVRVIDEAPASLDAFGLAPPRLQVEFRGEDGQTSGRLLVGSKTPTGANLYAMRDEAPQVFVIPAYQESSLNKSTFGLRDKTFVRFSRDQVTGVTINSGQSSIEFQKGGGRWSLLRPVKARADFSAVEGLVGRLETAQITSVVAEDAPKDQLRQYALDSPRTSVTLEGADLTVILGGEAESGVYARDVSKTAVVTIDSTLADDLLRGADEYRQRSTFDFRVFNLMSIAFTRGDQTVAFERVKGSGENAQDGWRRTAPSAGDVDRTTIESLLTGLADMRAVNFVSTASNTGLDKPVLVVAAKFEEGTRDERVSFGRRGDTVYAARPDEEGAAEVEAEKLDEAIELLDKLSQ